MKSITPLRFAAFLVLFGLIYLALISIEAVRERNEQDVKHRLEQMIREQEALIGPQHCRQATDRWACMTNKGQK